MSSFLSGISEGLFGTDYFNNSGGTDPTGQSGSGLPQGEEAIFAMPGPDNTVTPIKPTAPNNAFTTGLNLLFTDPSAFFGVLFTGDASNVPVSEVKAAATQNPLGLPSQTTVITVAVLAVVGLVAAAYILHKA